MTAKEIIEQYLRKNGFDGLFVDDWDTFGEDGCGCFLEDLCPCNPEWMDITKCKAGVRVENKDGSVGIGPKEEE